MLTYKQKELKQKALDILNELSMSFGKEETDLANDRKTDTFDYYYAINCRTLADMAHITVNEI